MEILISNNVLQFMQVSQILMIMLGERTVFRRVPGDHKLRNQQPDGEFP